jgi:hypothetical protein
LRLRKLALFFLVVLTPLGLGVIVPGAASAFTDVPEMNPFAAVIGNLSDCDIIDGYDDDTFIPPRNGYFTGESYDAATNFRATFGAIDPGPYAGRVVMGPGIVAISAWADWSFTAEIGEDWALEAREECSSS